MDIFEREEGDLYLRSNEEHTEYAHEPERSWPSWGGTALRTSASARRARWRGPAGSLLYAEEVIEMDQIVRAVTADGFVKISAVTARDTVERARQIHDLSPTACAALGRTLCGASMLGELMKEDDASLTIRVNGGGPAGSVIAVSDSNGNVRGYVTNPRPTCPRGPTASSTSAASWAGTAC